MNLNWCKFLCIFPLLEIFYDQSNTNDMKYCAHPILEAGPDRFVVSVRKILIYWLRRGRERERSTMWVRFCPCLGVPQSRPMRRHIYEWNKKTRSIFILASSLKCITLRSFPSISMNLLMHIKIFPLTIFYPLTLRQIVFRLFADIEKNANQLIALLFGSNNLVK